MQSPAELCPNVRPTRERGVFLVSSRSAPGITRRGDGEARFGLGACSWPDYTKGNNLNCHHIQQVRKFVMCVAMQGQMMKGIQP